jgi:hypothetical protein
VYNHFDFDGIRSAKGTCQLADANGLSRFAAIGERVAGQPPMIATISDHHKSTFVFSTTSFPVFYLRNDVRAIKVYGPFYQSSWLFDGFDGLSMPSMLLKCFSIVVNYIRGLLQKATSSRQLFLLAKLGLATRLSTIPFPDSKQCYNNRLRIPSQSISSDLALPNVCF